MAKQARRVRQSTQTKTRSPNGYGSLYQSVNNGYDGFVFETSYQDPDTGRRVKVRGFGETPALAVQRHNANIQKRMRSNGTLDLSKRTPTLENYLEIWLSSIKPKIGDETYRKYKRDIENHVVPYIGKRQLGKLTEQDFHHLFYTSLEEKGTSARYHAYKSLSSLIIHAVDRGVIDKNYLSMIPTPKHSSKVAPADKKYIRKRSNVASYLLKWLSLPDNPYKDHRNRILFMFLGLRRAEILGIEWDCITNIEKKDKAKLTVRQQLKRYEKHTGKTGWYIHNTTKNKKPREIHLPEMWRKALLDERNKQRVAQDPQFSQLVFLRKDGKPITWKEHDETWREILTAYWNKDEHKFDRLPDEHYFRPHAARHIAASLLFEAGANLLEAQEILGHLDQATTEHYTHLMDDRLKKATDSLAKSLKLE